MCGDEAAAARSMLQISYPVCAGSTRLPLSQSFQFPWLTGHPAGVGRIDGKWNRQEMG